MQLQVTNSPFNQEQAEMLNRLLATLSEHQRVWLSGFLTASVPAAALQPTAVAVGGAVAAPTPVATGVVTEAVSKEVTILYGSQTGNSQGLAEQYGKKLKDDGFDVTVVSMSDFKPNALKKIKNLLVIVSTHGEGDPPDSAMTFYDFLHSKRAPKLDDLQFSVLALGDTSYELFCQTGKDFDKRLEELGGKRLSDRVDCDLDFDEPADQWFASVLAKLKESTAAVSEANAEAAATTVGAAFGTMAGFAVNGAAGTASVAVPEQPAYSRTNPFMAEVLENLNLNGRGSKRETRHLELSLEGSKLDYEPGDCLAVYPENQPQLVDDLIQQLGWNEDELVPLNSKGELGPLREALQRHYEITVLSKPLLEKAAEYISNSDFARLLEDGDRLKEYVQGRDLLDLLQDFGPWDASPQQFVSTLRKLPARQYSIASSLKAYPDEAHLTIRTVRYHAHGRDRYGVCSVYCSEQLQPGDQVPVYVHRNPNFKLPQDSDAPIIMIGPGTGVAPFRAFMQEREEIGAEGRSWLFYGDQHFLTDFLYQTEWQAWLKQGVLTRMDVAFSRDTDRKVYVQHRMLEKQKEFYKWLEEGAYVYVCGDEKRMAHDVHDTLLTIIEQEGGISREQAEERLATMQREKRYQRDVY